MRYTTAVLPILAAAVAAEQAVYPAHLAAKRHILARQTATPSTGVDAGDASDCLTGLMSLYSTIPTPPPELVKWEEALTQTDLCSLSVPDSVKPAFSSYESEVVSWVSVHEKDISSALDQCPQYSSLAGEAVSGLAECSSGAAGGGAAQKTSSGAAAETTSDDSETTTSPGSAQTTGGSRTTGGGSTTSSGGANASTTVPPNAGARETGFLAAAIAAAGFVGAVAAL